MHSKPSAKDSIVYIEKRKVLGNTYSFVKFEEESRTMLRIFLVRDHDSTVVFECEDSFRYGDCNSSSTGASDYKVEGDKLMVWYYEWSDTHMDDRYHYYKDYSRKETYAIQKKGAIVRLKTEYAKNDPELEKFINLLLYEKYTKQSNR